MDSKSEIGMGHGTPLPFRPASRTPVRFVVGDERTITCEHEVRLEGESLYYAYSNDQFLSLKAYGRARSVSLPPSMKILPTIMEEDEDGEGGEAECGRGQLHRARARAYTMIELRPNLQGLDC